MYESVHKDIMLSKVNSMRTLRLLRTNEGSTLLPGCKRLGSFGEVADVAAMLMAETDDASVSRQQDVWLYLESGIVEKNFHL
jgi:hypothetical protein